MPVKWTPSHVQMLFWLAWGNNKVDFKRVSEAWPDIPGEDKPTPRAISEKISYIKKGVQEHGLAELFIHGFASLARTNTKPATRVKGENSPRVKREHREDHDPSTLPTPDSPTTSKGNKAAAVKCRKRRLEDSDSDSGSLTDSGGPATPPTAPVRASKRARKATIKAEQSTEDDDDDDDGGEPYQSDEEWSPDRVKA